MVFSAKGILNFKSVSITKKQCKNDTWKKYAQISCNSDIEDYYRWFLEKRFNLKLNRTLRGTHITIINDICNIEHWDRIVKKYHGKEIEFFYEIEPCSNGEHWWIRVHCPKAEEIRLKIGLDRNPYFGFHITLGHAVNIHLEHSKYILEQCKRFDLISYTTKVHFSKHTIMN